MTYLIALVTKVLLLSEQSNGIRRECIRVRGIIEQQTRSPRIFAHTYVLKDEQFIFLIRVFEIF